MIAGLFIIYLICLYLIIRSKKNALL